MYQSASVSAAEHARNVSPEVYQPYSLSSADHCKYGKQLLEVDTAHWHGGSIPG